MDGIKESQVKRLLSESDSRADFLKSYCYAFKKANDFEKRMWFDKTPQNIYGILLIRAEFPEAKFIHIVRNPLNVAASLKKGVIIHEHDLVAACSYWREAILIADQFRQAFPEQIKFINYEDLTNNPVAIMNDLMDYLNLSHTIPTTCLDEIHPEKNQYKDILTHDEIADVKRICSPVIKSCRLKSYF